MQFTQFLRPNGRQEIVTIDRSEDIEMKADILKDAGYRFEIEVLTNGMISMTACCDKGEPEDIAIKLCENGPKVPIAVDDLVLDAFRFAKDAGDFDV